MADVRNYAIFAIPLLVLLGAGALYSRTRIKALRVIGLVVSLVGFAILTLFYVVGVGAAFNSAQDGWGGLILAIAMMLFLPSVFPALFPLAALWLKVRLAWIVPAGVGVASSVLAWLALRSQGVTSSSPYLVPVVLGGLALSALFTWLACFFRNPRFIPPADAPPTGGYLAK